MYVCMCMYMYMYICMYVYMYKYIYMYVYTYRYTYKAISAHGAAGSPGHAGGAGPPQTCADAESYEQLPNRRRRNLKASEEHIQTFLIASLRSNLYNTFLV